MLFWVEDQSAMGFGHVIKKPPLQTRPGGLISEQTSTEGSAQNYACGRLLNKAALRFSVAFLAIASIRLRERLAIVEFEEASSDAFPIMRLLPISQKWVGVIANQQLIGPPSRAGIILIEECFGTQRLG